MACGSCPAPLPTSCFQTQPELASSGSSTSCRRKTKNSECITVGFFTLDAETSERPPRSRPAADFVCTRTSSFTFANESAGNKCHVLIYLQAPPAEVRHFFYCTGRRDSGTAAAFLLRQRELTSFPCRSGMTKVFAFCA